MSIDFGSIKNYNAERGFGFIGCSFSNPNKKNFFHIKKVKQKFPELAYKLEKKEPYTQINFWYETEITPKGKQVVNFWQRSANIPKNHEDELNALVEKVKEMWRSIESPQPSWLNIVTIELLGNDLRNGLNSERNFLLNQLKEEEERQKKEALQLVEDKIQRLHQAHDLTEEESRELDQLLSEMRPLNFTHSHQLSKHIVRYKLGYKYPNISGILRMEGEGREWDFDGGFPPKIYRVICIELGLSNKNTLSRPIGFTPFRNII
ncbi:MAG: cold shock domain-containing protein [Limnothrix sp. RL_2_0]|nr:cold shock domain-containing protein [Limnothrix sp. RL_2_0]